MELLNDCSENSSPKCFVNRIGLLVTVAPGTAFAGPLTQWQAEEEVLWEMLHRPPDAYSVKLDTVVVFDLWVPIPPNKQKLSSMSLTPVPGMQFDVNIVLGYVRCCSRLPALSRVNADHIRDVLGLVEDDAWKSMSPTRPVMRVLDGICRLIAAG